MWETVKAIGPYVVIVIGLVTAWVTFSNKNAVMRNDIDHLQRDLDKHDEGNDKNFTELRREVTEGLGSVWKEINGMRVMLTDVHTMVKVLTERIQNRLGGKDEE